jgi:uncharacterized protein (TIGR03435 family)
MIRKCAPFLALLFAWADSYAQSAAKPEFEAASIKPSPPPTVLPTRQPNGARFEGGCRRWPQTADPRLFTCENISLRSLILAAYGVFSNQLSAPDLPSTRFDLRATVPEGARMEQLSLMLQSLLEDRFKLRVHREKREMPRYELVIAKGGPKFKESAPVAAKDDDATFMTGPPKLDQDGYPIVGPRGGTVIVKDKARMHNPEMTMQALASQLSSQLEAPVTDATSLTGKYDIDMHWIYWPFRTATASVPPLPGGEPAASAPPGPTLTQALENQLGLRVESTKGPVVDFVVVDHAEKVPTQN